MDKRGDIDGKLVALIILIGLGIISLFYDSKIINFFWLHKNLYLDYFLAIFKPISIIFLFALLMALILWKEHKRKWALPLIITLVLSTIASFIIKFVVMRPRPFGLIETIPFLNLLDYSFPSSHAVVIFSALPILDKEFPRFKYVWIALACLVALSRVYFGEHYLSDVIFGGIIGYLVGYIVVVFKEKYKHY